MDDEPDDLHPPRRDQLSKTPSWVMLGFALGAACVLAWPRKDREPVLPPRIERASTPPAPEPPTVERAIFFESVFAQLGHDAIWKDDTTEVAFWNADKRAFSDCYEVLRVGDKYYFRSIPQLTRPVITKGMPPDSPLQFTMPAGLSIEIRPTYSWPKREGSAPVLAPPTTRADQVEPPAVPAPKPLPESPQKGGQ